MDAVLDNLQVMLPFFITPWVLFIGFTLWRPQRFRNSVFLLVSLFFTVLLLDCLFGDNAATAMLITFCLGMLCLLFVPFLLIWNGIHMLKRESRSVGNMLSLLLGAVIGVGEVAVIVTALQTTAAEWTHISLLLRFVGGSVFYFSVWILAFVLYILFIRLMPHRMDFDYVIIHGCGLLEGSRVSRLLADRIDKAIEVYRRCKQKPILIPSGGKGSDEQLSEAEAMKRYLLEHGIPEEHILVEDKSLTTMENLQNAVEIIRSRGGRHRTALVSSSYHIYRCLLYASGLKLRAVGIGARVAWYFWPSATLREFAAVFSRRPHVIWLAAGYVLTVMLPTVYMMK